MPKRLLPGQLRTWRIKMKTNKQTQNVKLNREKIKRYRQRMRETSQNTKSGEEAQGAIQRSYYIVLIQHSLILLVDYSI